MKKFFLLTLLIPVLGMAQKATKPAKPLVKNITSTPKAAVTRPDGGFIINGTIKGFPDGTGVALLNGQTGAPESETTVSNNTFTFAGKLETPSFKIILFDKKPPYVTLFLDNSEVRISGVKDSLEYVAVKGSPSNNDFMQFSSLLGPYQNLFVENAVYDSVAFAKAMDISANFIKQQPASYIAPLALIRYSQLTDDVTSTEKLYGLLSADVKNSPMGSYVAQQIAESKKNAIGTVMADFTQPDTTGKPVSLVSYRGKYVLVDFWASWCRPCRQENPNVVATYNKYKDKNFTVLGVSLDKAKPSWIEAIKMDGLTWGHVSDLQGWANSVAAQFQVTSIPQNFLLDPEGRIIGKNLRGPALERKLSVVLR